MKRCVVGIHHSGESKEAITQKYVPTVWFPLMATMAAVLSEDNQTLLRFIRDQSFKSLTELAGLTGRQVSNLPRWQPVPRY